ncbi:MAG: hypothetical protein NC452_02415 [Eubacterium sp.]|nr:hypothetical protein [Eubacterium sp.]
MIETADDFRTVSYNTQDVTEYLGKYYNYAPDNFSVQNITTAEIYQFAETLIRKKSFGEFLCDFLTDTSRITEPSADKKVFISYCMAAFDNSGIINAPSLFKSQNSLTRDVLKKQLKGWFEDVIPSRESIFKLAFALKLSCAELEDFLKIGICDKNVNYKSPSEAAAYGSLSFGKDYTYALYLLDKASEIKHEINKPQYVLTERYEDIYKKIKLEDELVLYLSKLVSDESDSKFSVCIKDCYDDLISDIFEKAKLDRQLYFSNETKNENGISFSTIERYIYGFTDDINYALYTNGNIAGSRNNRLGELKWFFSTLLRRSDMEKMYNEKKKISRDTILTLAFFVVCEEKPDYNAFELISEINEYLNFSRFEGFNFSFPYDMLLFMCLQTDDPIMSFRKVWKMSWK